MNTPAPGRMRVLIADDWPDIAVVLAKLVSFLGHEARAVDGGVDAMKIAIEFRPHVAFIGLSMSDLDGFEVARQLHLPENPRPPFLAALSGYGDEQTIERTREAGFDQHCLKPLSVETIKSIIERTRKMLDAACE